MIEYEIKEFLGFLYIDLFEERMINK